MFSTIYGWMKIILQLWNGLMALLGIIEKEKHEKTNENIKENTDVIGNPAATEEERLRALKELQDRVNQHS